MRPFHQTSVLHSRRFSALFISPPGGSGFFLQRVRGQANVTKLSWVFNVDLKLSGWLAPRMGEQVSHSRRAKYVIVNKRVHGGGTVADE